MFEDIKYQNLDIFYLKRVISQTQKRFKLKHNSDLKKSEF